ncbi:hypothetical protein TWF225_009190 [Orbilia oligospora]|uniref:Uncharacterized protein n=1 Tax=Orbilia oligospora TaxID=2813651 RepID=A0A7C8IZI6_ORBOL|nr:hypothetical protein TWF102_003296 [Orbilia oligospora]KAF3081006.1 hypothetical protein TWF706_002412 [Orbilia oligospora]KAF3112400.1 hypothetical protein TWF103_003184 [Orbilia oligospora]KAF3119860.1 hypothetical protein TWF703_003002 [Orbilia oligospora]KAF3123114.1 hypothetical protein TWF594_002525 [Orbilia oligospora]
MSQSLSDDEDMISSPSSPATPVNTTSNPHLPAHLDLKTPPQSQDNTPYASRIGPSSFPAPTSASTATLQTSTSTASATFHNMDNNSEMTGTTGSAPTAPASTTSSTIGNVGAGGGGSASGGSVATGGRRRQSQMTLAALQGGNNVSIMQTTEAGVPMWLTKRGTEEVHNIEERLLDRGFSTHMYGSIFNDKDMSLK